MFLLSFDFCMITNDSLLLPTSDGSSKIVSCVEHGTCNICAISRFIRAKRCVYLSLQMGSMSQLLRHLQVAVRTVRTYVLGRMAHDGSLGTNGTWHMTHDT
jgi:hypothetical protein